MKNKCLRVVLIEKVENKFPYSHIPIVRNIWQDGMHPKICQGTCTIVSRPYSHTCMTCGWDIIF